MTQFANSASFWTQYRMSRDLFTDLTGGGGGGGRTLLPRSLTASVVGELYRWSKGVLNRINVRIHTWKCMIEATAIGMYSCWAYVLYVINEFVLKMWYIHGNEINHLSLKLVAENHMYNFKSEINFVTISYSYVITSNKMLNAPNPRSIRTKSLHMWD